MAKKRLHNDNGECSLTEVIENNDQLRYTLELIERVKKQERSKLRIVPGDEENVRWIGYLWGPLYQLYPIEQLKRCAQVKIMAPQESEVAKGFREQMQFLKESFHLADYLDQHCTRTILIVPAPVLRRSTDHTAGERLKIPS